MHIVVVDVRIKPEYTDAFTAAVRENASNSLKETGVVRFDVLQHDHDSTRFLLYEVYRTAADVDRHKETVHYKRWRSLVEPMMAQPRVGTVYGAIYPNETDW